MATNTGCQWTISVTVASAVCTVVVHCKVYIIINIISMLTEIMNIQISGTQIHRNLTKV